MRLSALSMPYLRECQMVTGSTSDEALAWMRSIVPALAGSLERLSPRGTPAIGMVVAGVLGSALVAMNYSRGLVELFTFIILLSTLSTLVPYAFCSLAVWLMPVQEKLTGTAMAVSALAFIYAMFAIVGAGAETVFYGFLLLLAGLPVYVWVRLTGRPQGT